MSALDSYIKLDQRLCYRNVRFEVAGTMPVISPNDSARKMMDYSTALQSCGHFTRCVSQNIPKILSHPEMELPPELAFVF